MVLKVYDAVSSTYCLFQSEIHSLNVSGKGRKRNAEGKARQQRVKERRGGIKLSKENRK